MLGNCIENVRKNVPLVHNITNYVTVNACAKRLFGSVRVPHWTLNDAKLICRYIKSISVEEDAKRLLALHEAIQEIMGENSLDDVEVRKSVDKDTHMKEEIPEGGI